MQNKWAFPNSNLASPYKNKQTISNIQKIADNYGTPIKTITMSERAKTVKKPGKPFKEKLQKVKEYFYDYCQGTSLHGLKYVGVPEVTLFERCFWMVAFLGAMAFSAYFIGNIYERWGSTPVIVGINPQFQSVTDIPFPAITICNMNLARKSKVDDIIEQKNYPEMLLLSDLCSSDLSTAESASSINSSILNQLADWNFIKSFILKVSQPCSDMLIQCKWRGYEISCDKLFNSVLTDEGVCCTFNRLASKYLFRKIYNTTEFFNKTYPEDNIKWNSEDGYPPTAKNSTWPYRGTGAGEHIGLTAILNIAAEEYYCSSTSSVGLKIRLHSPVEGPTMADYGFFIHPRKEVRVSLKPTMDQASASIRKIPIKKRQCFFNNERELLFYSTYTKTNCEMECLSNYTAQKCGCVPYYLPSNNQKICDKSQENCYKFAKTEMDVNLPANIYCECLPSCNDIQYSQEHSLGDISNPNLRKNDAVLVQPPNLIILHFFYQSGQFRSFVKSELFGFTEFLSNSGGLLGLFLGFSFLSIVEILYHLTLKLLCISFRNNKGNVSSVVTPFVK